MYIDNPDYDPTIHLKFWLGGRLIKTDENYSNVKTIQEYLKLPQDREIIEKTELDNMWSHEDLQDRLIRYFDTGINRDDIKFYCFPELWDDIDDLRPLTRRVPIPDR